jgi:exosortase
MASMTSTANSTAWHRPPMPAIVLALPTAALAVALAWAYWPTLATLVRRWDSNPDYSHGYLVAPFALLFLWVRRDRFPGFASRPAWLGLSVIVLSLALRVLGGRYHIEALDGWSILLWLGGVAWLLGGWRVLFWAGPSIAFLFFAVPLPSRAELWASQPLQRVATRLSTWWLQFLGQPALAEGNVIILGEHELEVAQACSGLRIFVGIFALAFAYIIISRRAWWENLLLLASTVPVALAANAARVVVTGLLYQYASSEAAKTFSHDVAGWAMIPLAAGMFALVLLYLRHLTPEIEEFDVQYALGRVASHRGPRETRESVSVAGGTRPEPRPDGREETGTQREGAAAKAPDRLH